MAMLQSERSLSPIALLFDSILSSTPRHTSKQQTSEQPWLQYVFTQLVGCTDLLVTSDTISHINTSKTVVLEQMLQEAADHKVRLDASVLRRVMSICTRTTSRDAYGLLGWSFTSLCLAINPDIFLDYKHLPEAPTVLADRKTDNPLLSLLSDINELWCISTNSDLLCESVLSEVLLPLIKAFAERRDLIGFLHYWKFSLTTCQPKRPTAKADTSQKATYSIWESEKLSNFVSSLIEAKLTSGQIESILQEAHEQLNVYSDLSTSENQFAVSACLVVLDSILDGYRSEAAISKHSRTVESVFRLLLTFSPSTFISEIRWRYWRVLATICRRWSKSPTTIGRALDRNKFDKALGMIEGLDLQKYDYAEGLHAFSFLLTSHITIGVTGDEQFSTYMTKTALSGVRSIVRLASDRIDNEYLVLATQDACDHRKAKVRCMPRWSGSGSSVSSLDELLLASFVRIFDYNFIR